MSKLIKIELMKLKSSLAFKITIIVCALLSLMNVAIYGVIANIDKFIDVSENDNVANISSVMGESVNGIGIFRISVQDPSDYLMMAVIVIAICVCGDFSARTLQSQIIAGMKRSTIYVSRIISTIVVVFIFNVVETGILTIGTSVFCGFGEELTGKMAVQMIGEFGMCFFMTSCIAMMYLFIIFTMKSIGPSIGISLPILLIGTSLIGAIGAISDTAMKVYSFTPFGQQQLIGEAFDALEYVKFFGVGITFAVIMVLIGMKLFSKAELK